MKLQLLTTSAKFGYRSDEKTYNTQIYRIYSIYQII
jgi:hypothetical protein